MLYLCFPLLPIVFFSSLPRPCFGFPRVSARVTPHRRTQLVLFLFPLPRVPTHPPAVLPVLHRPDERGPSGAGHGHRPAGAGRSTATTAAPDPQPPSQAHDGASHGGLAFPFGSPTGPTHRRARPLCRCPFSIGDAARYSLTLHRRPRAPAAPAPASGVLRSHRLDLLRRRPRPLPASPAGGRSGRPPTRRPIHFVSLPSHARRVHVVPMARRRATRPVPTHVVTHRLHLHSPHGHFGFFFFVLHASLCRPLQLGLCRPHLARPRVRRGGAKAPRAAGVQRCLARPRPHRVWRGECARACGGRAPVAARPLPRHGRRFQWVRRPTGRPCSPRSASRTCAPTRPTGTRRSCSTTCGRGGPTWSSPPRSRTRSGSGTSPSSSRSRPPVLVDGQDLFWWGVRTPSALARLHDDRALSPAGLSTRAPADACTRHPSDERAAAGASATTQPPKPPPVMRAPCTPVGRGEPVDERVDRRQDTSKSSRRLAWLAGHAARAERVDVAGARARGHRVPHPLVLGQHVAGPPPQHRVVDGPLVAGAGQPQRADLGLGRLALAPPVGVRGAGQRAGHAGVHHHHLDVVGQRHGLDRRGRGSRCAARGRPRPAAEVSWSMIPQGTPGRRLLGPLAEQGEGSGVRRRRRGRGPAPAPARRSRTSPAPTGRSW